ncbi:hypothetical protein FSB78_02095 [Sphingomonas ginsenosidivorax]|uniref:Uncharacterized protein n=1 Tax=Sphingomonas ginsenosidivorax TaxID=862135 RepID=A0A5C6UAU3_9SPHN|nr:hypothetical protein [Sphingomonas ginsenosidivorax]TXC69882.1 hypothetical protein FSB78_02095 [Sphingomonas ginsenosidivorax]
MLKSFSIDTEYESYLVVDMLPGASDLIEQELGGLEFLKQTLDGVSTNNIWVNSNLRGYAHSILSQGSFALVDPKSGHRYPLSATYTFEDLQTIFFFFTDNSPVGLVASDLAAGFPLSTIILFERKIIIHLTDSFWRLGSSHFATMANRGDQVVHECAPDHGVCLVAGDQNFAHHAWNELSSLQEIADQGFDRTASLAVAHEPLGPVNDILGSHFKVIHKFPKARIPEINRSGKITFCSAGTVIDSNLVEKIVGFAEKNLSAFALEVRDKVASRPGSSLWVSVRTRNRTLSEQVEVMATLIKDYLRDRTDRMVIIDGHSLPFDQDTDAPYNQELNVEIARHDALVADQIVAAVKQDIPDAEIVRFVGRKIHESIAVGLHAGFYFCHHGTVQHKLGWFSGVSGLVHCNRDILENQPANWVKQQSRVASLPVYLPADLIGEASENQELGALQQHLRHNDYKILDVHRASRIIAEFADTVERSV